VIKCGQTQYVAQSPIYSVEGEFEAMAAPILEGAEDAGTTGPLL
jgi:hypothetical protein